MTILFGQAIKLSKTENVFIEFMWHKAKFEDMTQGPVYFTRTTQEDYFVRFDDAHISDVSKWNSVPKVLDGNFKSVVCTQQWNKKDDVKEPKSAASWNAS